MIFVVNYKQSGPKMRLSSFTRVLYPSKHLLNRYLGVLDETPKYLLVSTDVRIASERVSLHVLTGHYILIKYAEKQDNLRVETYSLRSFGRKEKACGSTPTRGLPLSSRRARPCDCCSTPAEMYLMRFPDTDLRKQHSLANILGN